MPALIRGVPGALTVGAASCGGGAGLRRGGGGQGGSTARLPPPAGRPAGIASRLLHHAGTDNQLLPLTSSYTLTGWKSYWGPGAWGERELCPDTGGETSQPASHSPGPGQWPVSCSKLSVAMSSQQSAVNPAVSTDQCTARCTVHSALCTVQ